MSWIFAELLPRSSGRNFQPTRGSVAKFPGSDGHVLGASDSSHPIVVPHLVRMLNHEHEIHHSTRH